MRILGLVLLSACAVDPTSLGTPLTPQETPIEPGAALDEIAAIEDHRLGADKKLSGYLDGATDPLVLSAAITAAGRINDASYESSVAQHLEHGSPQVRVAAVNALALLGLGTNALLARFDRESDAHVVSALLRALGAAGAKQAQPKIEAYLSTPNLEVLGSAAAAWASMVDVATPSTSVLRGLLACTRNTGREAVYCAEALRAAAKAWTSLEQWVPAADVFAAFDATSRVEVRYALLGLMRRTPGGKAKLLAITKDGSPTVRAGAYASLALLDADISAGLADASAHVRQNTLSLLKAPFDATRLETMVRNDASSWVRAEALLALSRADKVRAANLAESLLTSSSGAVAEAATTALATAGRLERLWSAFAGSNHGLGVYAGLALTTAGVQSGNLSAALKRAATDPTSDRLSAVGSLALALNDTATIAAMNALYPEFTSGAETLGNDMRQTIMTYTSDQSMLWTALRDPMRPVQLAAADRYKVLFNDDVSNQVRLNSVVTDETPSSKQLAEVAPYRVLLSTTRGDITVKLLMDAAPITAFKFVQRVQSGFYDGLTFHRVIPGFVAQGGDPTGTGSGSSPKFVRDEISRTGHRRGTLGVATSGRDTGSCQFFINLVDNDFLDANYTVFAEIESGMDVAEAIERDDVITRAVVMGSIPGNQ